MTQRRVRTEHRAAIVTKTFAQLDKGDGVGKPGDLSGHTLQGEELLGGGFLADEIGLALNDGIGGTCAVEEFLLMSLE